MIRLILLGLLFVVLYRAGMRLLGLLSGEGTPKRTEAPRAHRDAHEMVACSLCGTFISPQESEQRGGRWICKPRCPDTSSIRVG